MLLRTPQLSASARVAEALQDVAVSERLVAICSSIAKVAQIIRDEKFSDNKLSFSTEYFALNITMNCSVSNSLTDAKVVSRW